MSSWKKISFKNKRGEQLSGWVLWDNKISANFAVICHGFTGSKEGGGKTFEMAEEFFETGWNTLLFDFAGNGESEGEFSRITLGRQIQDLSAAVDWCADKEAYKIVTLGRSFGGSTVLAQGAVDMRVSGVCSWAAPLNVYSLFKGFLGSYDNWQDQEKIKLNSQDGSVEVDKEFMLDLQKHNLAEAARQISPRPLLIIHGEKDETVPVKEARDLYAFAKEPKELHIVAGADHRFSNHYSQVWQICKDWLQRI